MALIQCPKCGQAISNQTEQCIHCGFSFKICPECRSILWAGTDRCGNCGFVLPNKISPISPPKSPVQEPPRKPLPANYVDLSLSGSPIRKKLLSKSFHSLLSWIVLSVWLILFIGGFAVLYFTDSATMTASFWIAADVIILTFTVCNYLWGILRALFCVKWIEKNHYDPKTGIASRDFDKYLPRKQKPLAEERKNICFFAVAPSQKILIIITFAIRDITTCLFFISCTLLLLDPLGYDSIFSLRTESEVIGVLILYSFSIVLDIGVIIAYRIFKKKRDAWGRNCCIAMSRNSGMIHK